MRQLLLLVLSAFISIHTLLAIPAKAGVMKGIQPNGEEISIRIYGDEYYSYTTTEDGYLLTSGAEGEWEYAIWANNHISSTGILAKDVNNRAANDIAVLSAIGKFSVDKHKESILKSKRAKAMKYGANSTMHKLGDPLPVAKGLVILVNFTDVRFGSSTAQQDFTNLLNQEDYNVRGAKGCARNYFEDASYGKYSPDFAVYGPYNLDHDMAYYGAPSGDRHDTRPAQMVVDVIAKLMADKGNDIDLNDYDADGDKVVDNVFVFYAGRAQSSGGSANTVWPHKSTLQNNPTCNGVLGYQGLAFDIYACSSELNGLNEMCGIGTFSHEFSHVIGLPDVYDVNYSGHKTSGYLDIMDSGGHKDNGHIPCEYTAYERFFMGWLRPQILNVGNQYTLPHISENDTAGYIITYSGQHNMDGANPNPNIFFTLETRGGKRWDDGLHENGLIITRINFDKGTWASNNVNIYANNMGIDIIESSNGRDAFPNGEKNHYSPYDKYPITNIKYDNNKVDFTFKGGPKSYTIRFEDRGYGEVYDSTLTENEPFSGIILPSLSPDSTYVFEGWSTLQNAYITDAGKEGDKIYPKEDITLYAVYSINGEILLPHDGCITESFDKLTLDSETNLTETIDEHADNVGWTALNIYSNNGGAQVGTDSKKGELISPELLIKGSAYITIKAKCDSRSSINFSMLGQGELSVQEIKAYPFYETFELFLSHSDYSSKLSISSNENIFFIDNIEICATDDVSTDIRNEDKVMVIDNKEVLGLKIGDIVRCIDINGRTLWTEESIGTTMNIEVPNGLYLISIIRDNEIITIKSVN